MITQGSQCCFFINEYHSELHHSLHCTITSALDVLAVRIQENTADGSKQLEQPAILHIHDQYRVAACSSASSASASSSPYCRHEMKVPEIDNDCRRV